MKLNHKELSLLLQRPGSISGWLYLSLYDFAVDSKANDVDQYVRRWCIVQNNLLLTSKHEQGALETVIVLEDYSVKLCQTRSQGFGLVLVFHNSEYHMYCSSKAIAVKWIDSMRDCGYMSLMKKWKDLQQQYDSLLAQQNRISKCFGLEEFHMPSDQTQEIVVSCALPLNSSTQNTFASVYVQQSHNWVLHYQTESVNHTLTPHYSKTYHFVLNQTFTIDSVLRFCINDLTGDRILGFVICTMAEIKSGKDSIITRTLMDDNGNDNVGEITLELSSSTDNSLPTSHQSLLHIVNNASDLTLDFHRGFMFQSNYGKIHVSEQLWNHQCSISFPLAYIDFLLQKKYRVLSAYEEFTTLDPIYDPILARMINHHETALLNLVRAKSFLEQYKGLPFRKSVHRKEAGWEYVPTNLAVYAVGVCDVMLDETNYFTITVGAFSAHPLGYKQPLQTSLVAAHRNSLHSTKHDNIITAIDSLHQIWDSIEQSKQNIIDAIALEQHDVYDIAVILTTCISDITEFCKSPDVLMGIQLMSQAETVCTYSGIRERNWSTPETDYVWDGEKYREKKRVMSESGGDSHDLETDVKLAISAFIMAVERKDKTVEKYLLKMLATLEPMITESRQGTMFMLLLEENKIFNSFFNGNPDIELRMNQCFSQALTCLYSAFYVSLIDAITRSDTSFFQIIYKIGFLVQFQSLLSTYGPELAMLEDHWISINNLGHCSFILSPEALGVFSLSGWAYSVTIKFGVGLEIWDRLPADLKKGTQIQVNPVLFSKGVNEQQVIAEKVGTTAMQQTVNVDGLCKLEVFYMMYKQLVAADNIPADLARLESLMSSISQHVRSQIPKDIQLFILVDEAVRLLGGGRVTSCKSAKDRTAMSVTYESVSILARHHSLVSSGFDNALSAIRSHGVRPLNCKKNTGNSRYAFNALQLKILPKEYRPPIGSYGARAT